AHEGNQPLLSALAGRALPSSPEGEGGRRQASGESRCSRRFCHATRKRKSFPTPSLRALIRNRSKSIDSSFPFSARQLAARRVQSSVNLVALTTGSLQEVYCGEVPADIRPRADRTAYNNAAPASCVLRAAQRLKGFAGLDRVGIITRGRLIAA